MFKNSQDLSLNPIVVPKQENAKEITSLIFNLNIDVVTLCLSSPLILNFNFLSCGKCFSPLKFGEERVNSSWNGEVINEEALNSTPLPKKVETVEVTVTFPLHSLHFFLLRCSMS